MTRAPDGFEMFVEYLAAMQTPPGAPDTETRQRAMRTLAYAVSKYLRQERDLGTPRTIALAKLGQAMGYIYMAALTGCKPLDKELSAMTADAASDVLADGVAVYETFAGHFEKWNA